MTVTDHLWPEIETLNWVLNEILDFAGVMNKPENNNPPFSRTL